MEKLEEENVIEVRNAYKQYESKSHRNSVLNGFNMTVQQGTMY